MVTEKVERTSKIKEEWLYLYRRKKLKFYWPIIKEFQKNIFYNNSSIIISSNYRRNGSSSHLKIENEG
ncbi:unnamed protein product [Allacma fusca]|uniref:Uncharacterized protein n=1 Tax=Allacma fusca TaxID=39272 RepID=A0A8J2KZ24_9HEXA|nr:unnamed protein product [Allacma fusca]